MTYSSRTIASLFDLSGRVAIVTGGSRGLGAVTAQIIAAGGGRVSAALQAQAAWLYLRHTNSIDQAVAELTAVD